MLTASHDTDHQITAACYWKQALEQLWDRNRVHVGPDTSKCYRELAQIYDSITIHSFRSGQKCESWIVPPGWDVNHAYLLDPRGRPVVDWSKNKLSLFAYSPSFQGKIERKELERHLFSIPHMPERTPYHFRNQYRHWDPLWGFCIPHRVREKLPQGKYTVNISTSFLQDATMEMAEQVVVGEHEESILFVGHFDHPYVCNDGLTGCLAGHELLSHLSKKKTKLTYRMLSTVEIIGSVFYCRYKAPQNAIQEALFIATPGVNAPLAYQTSFAKSAVFDRIFAHVFRHSFPDAVIRSFRHSTGLGNDEIAYDVGGVNIPCGSIMRTPFAEYHTDLDDIHHVDPEKMNETIALLLEVVDILENNATIQRRFRGLPCLSHPDLDLYLSPVFVSHNRDANIHPFVQSIRRSFPQYVDLIDSQPSLLHDMMIAIPALCRESCTTLDIAERVNLPFKIVNAYLNLWAAKGLIEKQWCHPFPQKSQINPLYGLRM